MELSLVGRYGAMIRGTTVFSGDPKTPQLNLRLTAFATNNVVVRPWSGLNFGRVPVSERVTRSFTVESSDEVQFRILDLRSLYGSTTSVNVIEPGRRYRILVSNRKQHVAGRFYDRVEFTTDHPSLPRYRISAYGTIVP